MRVLDFNVLVVFSIFRVLFIFVSYLNRGA